MHLHHRLRQVFARNRLHDGGYDKSRIGEIENEKRRRSVK
jgi:hypothetical protein